MSDAFKQQREADEAAMRPRYAIALHGGAGAINPNMDDAEENAKRDALNEALQAGVAILEAGGSSLDAVEAAVGVLEDSPEFNAGRGAVYTADTEHEFDAAVMDGRTLGAGAVAAIQRVRHPVTLARQIMQRTEHILLAGPGAEALAEAWGLERPPAEWFHTDKRLEQLKRAQAKHIVGRDHDQVLTSDDDGKKYGTVGCVALDEAGNLAAATSTGGLTNKTPGRVGDTPIIGAGTYADNATCAVSCTGTGEQFMRHVAAYRVAALMEMKDLSLREAAEQVIHHRLEKGDGGLIAVSRNGLIAMPYNSAGMYRAAADAHGHREVRIWET
ncbi:MAG: isoaspartyl peptidase/L-asparaginase [Phycisphaeraceae bacterium]